MKYLGSKSRIANDILPILKKEIGVDQCYCEPFCGGCSIIQKMPPEHRRIANDNNRYLIAMWKALTMTGWKPPRIIDKSFYNEVRASYWSNDGKFDDATIGWVGFMASWNGRFFDGGYSGNNVGGRDYIDENIRNTMKQVAELKGVEWQTGSYSTMIIPDASLIYCDPPYKGTTTYTTSQHFDYTSFYDWARQMKYNGHKVFVSEYNMPGDFNCIWEKTITNTLNITKTYRPTERLYTI